MAQPPNILFLFSDQQRWDTLGCLNPKIRTPNLDRLARSGMVAERAYAPTPVCLPCRASVITGQYSSSHRATHNQAQLLQTHHPLLPNVLRQAGYATHMIGKSHLSPCHDPLSLESAPHIHNRRHFRDWHGPWYGFERADIAIGHTTEPHACGMHYGVWLEEHGIDTNRYFGHTEYEQYGTWDLPEEFHNSRWVADTTIESMRRSGAEGRPFFIWANFQDPHNPCMVPAPWSTMYAPSEIPAFGFKPGEPECFQNKPPFYAEILKMPGPYRARPTDPDMRGAGNVSHLAWTPDQVQANAACYYGMVSLMDKYIGRILDELDRLGMTRDTLVVFSSDHGDLLGDHGFWWKSLVCYEESIRVPFLASFPGRIPAASQTRAFQSLVDLFPTFCDFAGVRTPGACEGVTQRAVWEGDARSRRDHVIVEERPFDTNWSERMIVTDDSKLAFYANRDYGELYDMHADPHHVRNLWNDPRYAARKSALISRILSHEMGRLPPCPSPSRLARTDS